jgi:beta-lactamase class A
MRFRGGRFRGGGRRFRGRYLLLGLLALAALWWGLARQGSGNTDIVHTPATPAILPTQPGSAAPVRDANGCLLMPSGHEAPPAPARLSGRLGLYVAVIDPATLLPLRVVSHDPGRVFPLASAYKQAVLWALLRQKDAGTLKLTETFDVSAASQSLGNYPFDHSDVTTLATRMIHNSDNTATDLLHRRVGLQAVQQLADDLGLCRTRLILPTKAWWTAQAGLSPSFPGAATFAGLRGESLLRAAQGLDSDALRLRPDVLQHRLDVYFDHAYDPQADLGTQNVSTPAEFAHLVAAEFLRSGLSAPSQQVQRSVMATGFGRSRLPVPMTYFGGKGGNGWRMLSFSGYLHTAGGEDVVYAFMQHGADQQYTMRNTGAAFAWIGAAMKQVLLVADGGVAAPELARTGSGPGSDPGGAPPTLSRAGMASAAKER